jgi:hypothetical protein
MLVHYKKVRATVMYKIACLAGAAEGIKEEAAFGNGT